MTSHFISMYFISSKVGEEMAKIVPISNMSGDLIYPITVGNAVQMDNNKKLNDVVTEIQSEVTAVDNKKVDKVTGKGLSSEDFTTSEKTKLAGLANIATSGSYNDLIDKPTVPQNILDGNSKGSIRSIGARTNYTMGEYATATGQLTTASGESSVAMGYNSKSIGAKSLAMVSNSVASSYYSVAIGDGAKSDGSYATSIGCNTTSSGSFSMAMGYNTTSSGSYSITMGSNITSETYGLLTAGRYNKVNSGSPTSFSSSQNAFVIGNGTSTSALSNCFRVSYNGNVYGLSAFNSTGADYAEYFEWDDGNPNNEDRIGHFVSLTTNGKIKIADIGEEIIGVISGNCSMIGDAHDDVWQGMYEKDVFGRFLYEDVEVVKEETTNEIDKYGNPIMKKVRVIEHRLKLNPQYDASKEYVPRKDRKEWDVVGLLGKLILIDDGSCIQGEKCDCGKGGIATKGNKYTVIKRIDDTHIVILF